MNNFEIFSVAFALSLDAFICAVISGSLCDDNLKRNKMALQYGLTFGFFQFAMPLIGFIGGQKLLTYISYYDHWVSFILLLAVSINMIYEALKGDSFKSSKTGLFWLLSLGIATSIDALAVGLSLVVIDNRIFYISILIGIVCFTLSAFGVYTGVLLLKFQNYSKYITFLGAAILIYIGFEVLIAHGVFW